MALVLVDSGCLSRRRAIVMRPDPEKSSWGRPLNPHRLTMQRWDLERPNNADSWFKYWVLLSQICLSHNYIYSGWLQRVGLDGSESGPELPVRTVGLIWPGGKEMGMGWGVSDCSSLMTFGRRTSNYKHCSTLFWKLHWHLGFRVCS